MAGKLANEAADECWLGRHFDHNLSNDNTRSFRFKYWGRQISQVQTAEGPAETRAGIRNLDESSTTALHDKHNLGQSNQNSLYFQLQDKLQPFQGQATLWCAVDYAINPRITQQLQMLAFQRHMPYTPRQAKAINTSIYNALGADMMTIRASSLRAACTQTWANNT